MNSENSVCEHCGGIVGDDGLALELPEEAKSEEAETPPQRDFAKAVAEREG